MPPLCILPSTQPNSVACQHKQPPSKLVVNVEVLNTNVSTLPPNCPAAPPRIWNYRQCMEVDTQYFWSGAPWDIVARAYVADTLNNAPRVDRQYSQSDVIAVSAMEGIGLASECVVSRQSTTRVQLQDPSMYLQRGVAEA